MQCRSQNLIVNRAAAVSCVADAYRRGPIWFLVDGQTGPCMGRCSGGAWHGAWCGGGGGDVDDVVGF